MKTKTLFRVFVIALLFPTLSFVGVSHLETLPSFTGNFAGTITIDPSTHMGSSNDVSGDPIYLCLNDLISIDHDAGSAVFTGDPEPSTEAGVGYIFYSCPPSDTFDGDLTSIQNDPCVTLLNLSLIHI